MRAYVECQRFYRQPQIIATGYNTAYVRQVGASKLFLTGLLIRHQYGLAVTIYAMGNRLYYDILIPTRQ